MTEAELRKAADESTPVRLKDRTTCNYVNEWYMPFTRENGTLAIDTHTGEVREVDEALIESLQVQGSGTTVGEMIDRLSKFDREKRLVKDDGNGGFEDIESIDTATMAVESRSEGDDTRLHGPAGEAGWQTPSRPRS